MASWMRSTESRDLPAKAGALRGGHLADSLGAFEQQDVRLARAGQRVGHTQSDGAAADDDDFRVGDFAHS